MKATIALFVWIRRKEKSVRSEERPGYALLHDGKDDKSTCLEEIMGERRNPTLMAHAYTGLESQYHDKFLNL